MTCALRSLAAAAVVLSLAAPWPAGAAPAPRARAARAPRATAVRAGGDSVLVRIGRDAITSRMVQARIDELPEQVRPNFGTPEGRQRLLDRMVEEKVWLEAALRKGVADRPEVRRQIEQQRRDLLIRTYVTELMGANPAPDDAEARTYYDEHVADFRMPATVTLGHILLKTESEARRIAQWAKGGRQDWRKLVERYSADSLMRKTGGSLGTVTREGVFAAIGTQPALAESAFALGSHRIGGPWRTDRGWHVVQVDTVKQESVRPFEQVRGQILRQLGSRKSQDYYQSRLEEAKRTLGVSADSTAIRRFVSQRKPARELFNEAQSAGAPGERIEGYRKVLSEYPDSDVSPQAQFMIGFIQSEELKDYTAAEASFRELLSRYPKSELVPSAQWMIDHMRTDDAPAFMNLESDTTQTAPLKKDRHDQP